MLYYYYVFILIFGFIRCSYKLFPIVFLSMALGYNPMVGATVAVAVSIEEAAKNGKF